MRWIICRNNLKGKDDLFGNKYQIIKFLTFCTCCKIHFCIPVCVLPVVQIQSLSIQLGFTKNILKNCCHLIKRQKIYMYEFSTLSNRKMILHLLNSFLSVLWMCNYCNYDEHKQSKVWIIDATNNRVTCKNNNQRLTYWRMSKAIDMMTVFVRTIAFRKTFKSIIWKGAFLVTVSTMISMMHDKIYLIENVLD